MSKKNIGIIGNGFVGEAQAFAFSSIANIFIYDINPLKTKDKIEKVYQCDYVFICVPTPMNKNGSQDISYVEDVFTNAKPFPIYIIKSTVLPGTTEILKKKFPDLKIIFSPEFLTERTAKLDMLTQSRIILGGEINLINLAEELYSSRFKNKNIIKTDSITAELVKYMNNVFFASKISLMNEFKSLCEKIGANWEDALHGFVADGRIADSHLDVPGHDGMPGYGGTCFPKDVNALITFSKNLGLEMKTISGAWQTNLRLRPQKDWEKKIGRSVNFKNK